MRKLNFIKLAGLIAIVWFTLSVSIPFLFRKGDLAIIRVAFECLLFPVVGSGSVSWVIFKLLLNALGHGILIAGYYKLVFNYIPKKHRLTFILLTVGIYCVPAYIFMWPPVVTRYFPPWSAHPCINNLRQVDAAINQFALEHNKHADDPVAWNDLTPYIKLNSKGEIPGCHLGGKYTITVVGEKPTCSYIPYTVVRVGMFHYYSDCASHMLP
jgi:hypothetical protein